MGETCLREKKPDCGLLAVVLLCLGLRMSSSPVYYGDEYHSPFGLYEPWRASLSEEGRAEQSPAPHPLRVL